MDLFKRFKTLPSRTRNLMSLGLILGLTIALPLFVWALVNLNFNQNKKAASGEPSVCIPDGNKTIVVTDAWGTEGGTCHDIQTAIDAVVGSGYKIVIHKGDYNITNTIYIIGKNNLTIEGSVEGNIDEVWLSFNTSGVDGGGWGIKVENSSGSINRLHAEGVTPNGLLSIQNTTNFSVNHTYLFGTSSHTFDVQNSSEVEISDSEIKSSAGAVEIDQSSNVNVINNKIHNSSTGVRASNSTYVSIIGNLFTTINSGAIRIWNVSNTGIYHNTIVYNTGSSPTVNISGMDNSSGSFSQNIVAFNTGAGVVKEANSINFSTISYNDVFSNYGGQYNYAGMTDPTGINGNISIDPLINFNEGSNYCLYSDSPAIYGIREQDLMGSGVRCGVPSLSTATPTASPIANVNPPVCTQSSIPPATGMAPLTVTLHGSGNASNGTGFDGYKWDFENDGVWDTGIQLDAINHVYTQPGTYHPVYQIHGTNDVWSVTCNYPYPVVVKQLVPGDVNKDGKVNIVDLGIIVDFYGQPISDYPNADLSGDGKINVVDIGIVIDNY